MTDPWTPMKGGPIARNPQGLPKVVDVLNDVVSHVSKNFGPYILGGLAFFLVILGVMLVCFGGGAAMAVASVALFDKRHGHGGDPDPALVFGIIGGAVVLLFAMIIAMAPLQASVARAILGWMRGGPAPAFGAPFATPGTDAGRVIGLMVITMLLTMLGAMCCYLPGILVGLFFDLAMPAMIVHRLSVGDSIRLSYRHVRAHFSWHLGYYFLGLAMVLIVSYLPLIGAALVATVYPAYQLRVYTAIFGAGERPEVLVPPPAPAT